MEIALCENHIPLCENHIPLCENHIVKTTYPYAKITYGNADFYILGCGFGTCAELPLPMVQIGVRVRSYRWPIDWKRGEFGCFDGFFGVDWRFEGDFWRFLSMD